MAKKKNSVFIPEGERLRVDPLFLPDPEKVGQSARAGTDWIERGKGSLADSISETEQAEMERRLNIELNLDIGPTDPVSVEALRSCHIMAGSTQTVSLRTIIARGGPKQRVVVFRAIGDEEVEFVLDKDYSTVPVIVYRRLSAEQVSEIERRSNVHWAARQADIIKKLVGDATTEGYFGLHPDASEKLALVEVGGITALQNAGFNVRIRGPEESRPGVSNPEQIFVTNKQVAGYPLDVRCVHILGWANEPGGLKIAKDLKGELTLAWNKDREAYAKLHPGETLHRGMTTDEVLSLFPESAFVVRWREALAAKAAGKRVGPGRKSEAQMAAIVEALEPLPPLRDIVQHARNEPGYGSDAVFAALVAFFKDALKVYADPLNPELVALGREECQKRAAERRAAIRKAVEATLASIKVE